MKKADITIAIGKNGKVDEMIVVKGAEMIGNFLAVHKARLHEKATNTWVDGSMWVISHVQTGWRWDTCTSKGAAVEKAKVFIAMGVPLDFETKEDGIKLISAWRKIEENESMFRSAMFANSIKQLKRVNSEIQHRNGLFGKVIKK